MSKSYQQTIEWLFAQLPMFHRVGAAAYKANLDNTYALMNACGQPHIGLKTIHIAGTNGKGSSSHMLASIFQSHGYKTGLYTSPHLVDFRERIRINGEMISQENVIEFVEQMKSKVEDIRPSFFEWTVALAFHHFQKEKVEIAIIETGLGGRLDSTNVISPELSLITNISMDHAALLGDTLEKIAGEKAGIIKNTAPVVISEHSSIDAVFIEKAKQVATDLYFASDSVEIRGTTVPGTFQASVKENTYWNNMQLQVDLQGAYQGKNIAGVLCSVLLLKDKWKLQDALIKEGIEKASSQTGLQGRWMCLQEKPRVVADIAHNEAGIQEVVQSLARYSYKQLHIVFGAVQDKEVSKVLALLPQDAHYYACAPNLPRALAVEQLLEKIEFSGRKGEQFNSVQSAYNKAVQQASSDDFVLVCGSNFVVAEVLESMQHDKD
jgi:dihydrofolate synthase/folylpolyglutamate synthase